VYTTLSSNDEPPSASRRADHLIPGSGLGERNKILHAMMI
jgi:hypothetical protein